jgi:hypothetical protein
MGYDEKEGVDTGALDKGPQVVKVGAVGAKDKADEVGAVEPAQEPAAVVNAAVEQPGDSEVAEGKRTDARGRELNAWETAPKPAPEN